MMMNSTFRRAVALPMLLMMTACTTMQPVSRPREFMKSRQPSVVWVNHSGQKLVSLEGPQLVGDSIVGFIEGEYTEIPMSQIESMHAKQYSRSRTTAFVAGMVGVAAAAILLLSGGMGAGMDEIGEDDIGIVPLNR